MQHRDEIWWAYLDGEMTPAEAAAFDRSLTPEERQCLERELALEKELGDVLSAPVPCPRDAWAAAKTTVKKASREQAKYPRWVRWGLMVSVPAAALIAILVLAVFPEKSEPEPLFLALKGKDMSDIAARSQVGDGVAGVRELMQKCSLPIELNPADPLDGQTTPYRLLGAREDHAHGERIVQLIFDCNGQAAVLVIAQGSGWAADEIGKAFARGEIRATRAIGSIVIAVAGHNAPRDLIRVVDDDWPAPEAPEASEEAHPSTEPQVEAPVTETPTPEAAQEPPENAAGEGAPDSPPDATPSPNAVPPFPPSVIDSVPATVV